MTHAYLDVWVIMLVLHISIAINKMYKLTVMDNYRLAGSHLIGLL